MKLHAYILPRRIKDGLHLRAPFHYARRSAFEVLEEGLSKIAPKTASAQALLNFVKMIEKIPTKGKVPKDAVENMDYYTWGGSKRK